MPRTNIFKYKPEPHGITEAKRMLCRKIIVAIRNDYRTHEQAAAYLGTSRAVISRMHNERTEHLTFNQLFLFLARLRPHFQILISGTPNA
jgi:hypothetical protein